MEMPIKNIIVTFGLHITNAHNSNNAWTRSSKVNHWHRGSRIGHIDKMNVSLKCTAIQKRQSHTPLEMLRVIGVTFIVLISGNRLQFGTGNGTTCCRVRYSHNTNDWVCVLGPIQASGEHKKAERQTLAREHQNEQVRAHCPVVVDEAGTFVAFARRLLPRQAGFVDQKSKQHRSWYHAYTDGCKSTENVQ